MSRSLFASLCLAFGLLMPLAVSSPAPAQGVSLNIHIGSSLNNNRRMSCGEGERLLRNRGFRDIRRLDCRGRHFVYRARRGNNRYEITVNSNNGRVVDVRRLRR